MSLPASMEFALYVLLLIRWLSLYHWISSQMYNVCAFLKQLVRRGNNTNFSYAKWKQQIISRMMNLNVTLLSSQSLLLLTLLPGTANPGSSPTRLTNIRLVPQNLKLWKRIILSWTHCFKQLTGIDNFSHIFHPLKQTRTVLGSRKQIQISFRLFLYFFKLRPPHDEANISVRVILSK